MTEPGEKIAKEDAYGDHVLSAMPAASRGQTKIGVGTLLLCLVTVGWWLLAILFYQKRCPICNSPLSEVPRQPSSLPGQPQDDFDAARASYRKEPNIAVGKQESVLPLPISSGEISNSSATPPANGDPTRSSAQLTPSAFSRVDRTAFADEFMKLAKLKEQGVLSEQEFSEIKAALIGQAKKHGNASDDRFCAAKVASSRAVARDCPVESTSRTLTGP